jgi:hypothetical protein
MMRQLASRDFIEGLWFGIVLGAGFMALFFMLVVR